MSEILICTGEGQASISTAAIEELRARLRGGLRLSTDPSYNDARCAWIAMIDCRPAIVPLTSLRNHILAIAVVALTAIWGSHSKVSLA